MGDGEKKENNHTKKKKFQTKKSPQTWQVLLTLQWALERGITAQL